MTAFRWALVIFGALLVLALLSGRVEGGWSVLAAVGTTIAWLASTFRHPPPAAPVVTDARVDLDAQLRTADDAATAKYAADLREIEARHAAADAQDDATRAQAVIDGERKLKAEGGNP